MLPYDIFDMPGVVVFFWSCRAHRNASFIGGASIAFCSSFTIADLWGTVCSASQNNSMYWSGIPDGWWQLGTSVCPFLALSSHRQSLWWVLDDAPVCWTNPENVTRVPRLTPLDGWYTCPLVGIWLYHSRTLVCAPLAGYVGIFLCDLSDSTQP